MTLRRPRWPVVLTVVLAIFLGALLWAWETDSGYYAYLPDTAHPAANAVHASGGKPPAPGTGFYFVDVHVLKANEIEKLWAEHLVDGSTLISADKLLGPGESDTERLHVDMQAMADSKTTAAVVAERQLGEPVKIDRQGALVTSLEAGYPAEKAGMKPGDVITSADGVAVYSAQQLVDELGRLKPGDAVKLGFKDGPSKTVVTVANPQDRKRAMVGISIGDSVAVGAVPTPVTIATPGIGGPSAGLAFALEIYDSLSGRHLLDGHKIAVTGELDLAGGVHTIGGVKQKTIGAIQAGADTFIVPAGSNARDARAAAGGHLQVIGVKTFAEALRAIQSLPPA